jgi:molecular chaperone GrpE
VAAFPGTPKDEDGYFLSRGEKTLAVWGTTDTPNERDDSCVADQDVNSDPEDGQNRDVLRVGESDSPAGSGPLALLEQLVADVKVLRLAVEAHPGEDEAKADVLRRAYQDLEDARRHATRLEWRPLYLDLILLLDRVENGVAAWTGTPAVEDFVSTVRDEIVEILARQGVVPVVSVDTRFDPHRQRALSVAPTDDPTVDHAVLSVVRRGYECDGFVLRPEEVVVARFRASATQS